MMSNVLLLILVGAIAASPPGFNPRTTDVAPAKPLIADYTIYSGTIGNAQAPIRNDRKLAIEITGNAAREIFNSMYPDVPGVRCSDEKGERLRRKGRIWCAYSPRAGYRCFLGYDLRTGESISGGSC